MRTVSSISAFIAILTLSSWAFAHDGGHGTKVPGTGPNGGKMSAVIAAADAEKGSEAATQGVAEWKQKGAELEVYLWDKSPVAGTPTAVSVPVAEGAKAELKWIVIYGSHSNSETSRKPLVVKSELAAPATTFKHAFDPHALKFAKTIEVILPAFGTGRESSSQKHVFEMKLEPQKKEKKKK